MDYQDLVIKMQQAYMEMYVKDLGGSFSYKRNRDDKPAMGPEIPKGKEYKTSELTARMGRNAQKMKSDPNHPVSKVNKRRSGK